MSSPLLLDSMIEGAVFTLTVTFAMVTGTAAGLLSILSWRIFRHSPLGKASFALSMVLSTFTLYHVVLITAGVGGFPVRLFEAAVYTGLAVFIGLTIRSQWRVRDYLSGVER